MKTKNARIAFIVLSFLIICLVILCTFLIAERNVMDRIQAAYEQGEQDGYEKGVKEKSDNDGLRDLEPWEQYKKGYVCYTDGSNVYHFSGCRRLDSNYDVVPEDYALIKGAVACPKCMPGSKHKFVSNAEEINKDHTSNRFVDEVYGSSDND